jgi:hypothetical protein
MARIVAIEPDLLFASRIEETLAGAGHEVTLSPSLGQATLESADLLIADLQVENPRALVGLGIPVLGFYPHIDAELRRAGAAAGLDLVVPRSRFAREMGTLVSILLIRN